MKYINCPQCNNKIIDRTPLKCLYCGYDSMNVSVEDERIELLEQPKRPSKENYTIIQSITLLISLVSAIAFLITFLLTKATVIDGVLVESTKDISTIRYILGIAAVLSFITFISSNRNFENEQKKYNQDLRMIKEINYKIELGAGYGDFDEDELAYIINAQELKKNQTLNQKSPTSKYYNY